MEAVAKHDFKATASDELSFQRGDVLKIINCEDDANWFKAELNGEEGMVPNNYIEMKPNDWFVGRMTRMEAENLLLRKNAGQFIQPDGAFLVRNSESTPNEFSMSVKWYKGNMKRSDAEKLLLAKSGNDFIQPEGAFLVRGCESQPGEFSISVKWNDGIQHFKILRSPEGKYFLWVTKFNSINELVENHRTYSVSKGLTITLKDMYSPEVWLYLGFDTRKPVFGFPSRWNGGVQHFKILRNAEGKYFLWVAVFNSINELVENHRIYSVSRGHTICLKDMHSPEKKVVCQAMYDFTPQEEGELKLKKNDEVTKDERVDQHWWRGTNKRTGQTGLYPANYVKEL